MDRSCRECLNGTLMKNLYPEICKRCYNYYPEEHEKPPEPVYQMKYKVIRFINPKQERINAQQNFKIAQVESHLKEHLDKGIKSVKKWQ